MKNPRSNARSTPVQYPQNLTKSLPALLSRWLGDESKDLRILIFYGLAVGITLLIVPISVQALVNTIAFGSVLQPIVILSLVVFGFLALSGLLRLNQLIVIEKIQVRLFVRTSLQIASRLTDISLEELQRNRIGSVVNRFLDIATVQKTFAYLCLEGIALALQLITSLLLLTLYHPTFLVFSVLLALAVALLISLPLKRGIKSAKQESQAKYEMTDFLEELGDNHLLYRSNRLTQRVRSRVDALALNYVTARRSHFETLRLQHAISFVLQAFFSALLLGLGGWLVVKGQLSLGQLVAAEILISSLLLSLTKVGKLMENLFDLVASSSKVESLLDLELERQGGLNRNLGSSPRSTGPFALELDRVALVSGPLSKIDDISVAIHPGEAVAFTGGNGTGKSALIELMYGLRVPSQGEIRIDGHPLRELDLASVRSEIVLVQGVQLVDGTVLDNIRLDCDQVSLDEVRELLKEFGLDKSISFLSEGLNTQLDATRPPFSKGQLQKLMLIRALVQKPRLLLLDEAIDSIDPETKMTVIQSILRRRDQFSLIVATHSPELAARCDRSFMIQDGKLKPVQLQGAIQDES